MKKVKFLTLTVLIVLGFPLYGANISEYSVKAAYIFNFAKSVEWPDDAFDNDHSPIVIDVLGQDPFGSALDDAVKGKKVGTRALSVKRFESFDPEKADDLKKGHILFISSSEQDRVKEILKNLKGSNLLTVSEIEQFPAMGGTILFDQEGDRIALVLNKKSAKKAGLTLSPELVQLSRVYKKVDAKRVKVLFFEGVNQYINGKVNEAIKLWEECLEEDPDNASVQQNIDKARAKLKSIKSLN